MFALAVWVPALLAAAEPSLDQVERLYEKARYEEALQRLGATCRGAADLGKCERMRAFIETALGHEDEARAAFERMLASEPEVGLGAVAPKVQALFLAATQNVQQARGLALAPIEASEGWVVQLVAAPAGLAGAVAHVRPAGHAQFQRVELLREGDAFTGRLAVGEVEAGPARYFLELRLVSGAELYVGSSKAPREVEVRPPAPPTPSPFALPGLKVEETQPREGMPAWAVWSIAGGAALVVAGIVTFVALSGEPEPGAIRVNIRFEDDP